MKSTFSQNRFRALEELQRILGFRRIDMMNLLKIVLKSDDCLLNFSLGDITVQLLRGSEAWTENDGNEQNEEYEDIVQLIMWLHKENFEEALSYKFGTNELAFAKTIEQTPSETEREYMKSNNQTRSFQAKQDYELVDVTAKTNLARTRALGRTVAKTLYLLRKFSYPLSVTAVSKGLSVKHERANEAICFLNACGWLEVSTEKHGSLRYQYVQLSNTGKKMAKNAAYAMRKRKL